MTDKHIPQCFPCTPVILPDSATEANILAERSLKLPTQTPADTSHWSDLILNAAGVSPYIKTRPNLTMSYSQVYWLKKLHCLKLSHTCSVWIMTGILPINLILWAVTVIGMHLPIIFKGYGDLRNKTNKHACDYQGFATSSQLCQFKLRAKNSSKAKIFLLMKVPLLSPLIFFSSRRSCASYSLSNSICSIWASIRSLEVSIFSPVINGPSAALYKMKTEIF